MGWRPIQRIYKRVEGTNHQEIAKELSVEAHTEISKER